MTTLALSFLAGLLTILSPCVLPLAPLVVSASRAQTIAGPRIPTCSTAFDIVSAGPAVGFSKMIAWNGKPPKDSANCRETP